MNGEPGKIFYVLVCLRCGDPEHSLPMPFESAAARGKWAAEHTRATGHDKWLVLDQPETAELSAAGRNRPARGNWPFTPRDLTALQAAYDTLTRAGNQTAAADGTWQDDLDQAHHRLGLILAHHTAARARFEAAYAARSGVTVGQLHAWGRYAEPCTCDDPACEGWVMGYPLEDALTEDAIRPAGTLTPARPPR
jgi:hypothetical protein